ncbi:MAG: putative alpha/beta-hydrolase family hydrolase, partial [Myxococcota bacterium]
SDAPVVLLLAHGAGAPMDTPFLNEIAMAIAAAGIEVVRFEFPYMRRRRLEGIRPGPNTAAILRESFLAACATCATQRPGAKLAVGGKSMGGRIATMIADEVGAVAAVALGYPFHPPGKPEKLRTAHLEAIRTPTLILQGERDPFGRPEEVAGYPLGAAVSVAWVPDGDHSLKPRKRSGHTEADNRRLAAVRAAAFVKEAAIGGGE